MRKHSPDHGGTKERAQLGTKVLREWGVKTEGDTVVLILQETSMRAGGVRAFYKFLQKIRSKAEEKKKKPNDDAGGNRCS